MRGRKQNSRSQGQRRRRCLLAGLLVASGQVALADLPVAIAPLPLVLPSGQVAGQLQVNPFCQPVPAAPGELTKLATRVVLVPQEADAGDTPWADMPSIRRSPARIIPFAPEHPQDGDPFVVQSSAEQDDGEAVPAGDGGMRSLIQEAALQAQPSSGGVRSNPLVRPVPMPVSDVQGVKPLVVVAERSQPAPGPVSFSFSDENPAPIDTTPAPPRSSFSAVVRESIPAEISPPPARSPRPKTAWRDTAAQPSGSTHPSGPSATLARPSAASKTILVPIQDPHAVATVGEVRMPQSNSRLAEEARLINGSRPKVDVGRPPLAIVRNSKRSLEVKPPPQPSGKADKDSAPEPAVTARLRLKPTEVHSLKSENTIQRAEVQSAQVCAVMKTGPNQVQLIATGDGMTKVTLWTVDSAGKQHQELYEIHVAAVQTAQVDGPQQIAETLTQSVGNAFPQSNVRVRYRSGRLTATGTCEDEESARRILRMIRSACQMPVDDKVLVR